MATGRTEHGGRMIIMSSDCGAELRTEDFGVTTPSEKAVYNKAQLEKLAEPVGYW